MIHGEVLNDAEALRDALSTAESCRCPKGPARRTGLKHAMHQSHANNSLQDFFFIGSIGPKIKLFWLPERNMLHMNITTLPAV